MRQIGESVKDKAREEYPMFIMLREEVPEAERPGFHLFKKRNHSIPLVLERNVHAMEINENAYPKERRGKQQRSNERDKGGASNRLGPGNRGSDGVVIRLAHSLIRANRK
jgi:hypothetical protein